jgi:capsular polysaccharide biosynthesis protein
VSRVEFSQGFISLARTGSINPKDGILKKIRSLLGPLYRRVVAELLSFIRPLGRSTIRLGPAIGFYSAYDQPEDVSTVFAQQDIPPASSESLRRRCGLNQDKNQPWPFFWTRVSQARLVGPSLALMDSQKRLMIESVYDLRYIDGEPSLSYFCLPPVTRLQGPWTSIISRWCRWNYGSYFHWIIDGLSRLSVLDRFPSDTRILVPGPMNRFRQESLEILGISDRCRVTPETHLMVEDYYFSSPTAMTGCDNPHAIHFLRGHFLKTVQPCTPPIEKIYISRRNTRRGAVNEQLLIDALQSEGWFILEAEKTPLREQIALFSQARTICGIHGAGFTNLLWCQKGCKVLELCAVNYLNGCFEGLAAYLSLDHRYLICPADEQHHLQLDLDQVIPAIRALG